MALAEAPVDEQVLHQERPDDHADPVVHPARSRGAGACRRRRSGSRCSRPSRPRSRPGRCATRSGRSARASSAWAGPGSSASRWAYQSRQASWRTNVGPAGGLLADGVDDRAGRQRAEPQVGREQRGAVDGRAVAVVVVAVDPLEELLEAHLGLGLALEHRRRAVERRHGLARVVEQRGVAGRRPRVPRAVPSTPCRTGVNTRESVPLAVSTEPGRVHQRAPRRLDPAPSSAVGRPGGRGPTANGVTSAFQ